MASPSRTRSSTHRGADVSSRSGSIDTSTRSTRVAKERRCQYCEKTFSKTEHLLRHERGHTKERPFRCEICGRVYGRHDTLLRHAKGHTPEKHASKTPGDTCFEPNARPSNDLHSGDGSQDMASATPSDSRLSGRGVENRSRMSQAEGDFGDATNLGFDGMTAMQGQSGLNSNPLQDSLSRGTIEQSQYLTGDFSAASFHGSGASPFSDANLWGASWMSPGPSWLAGFDFDLDALNTSVLATMDMAQPPPLFQPTQNLHNSNTESQESGTVPHVEVQKKQRFMDDVMRRSWFTRVRDVDRDDELGRYTSGRNTPAIPTEGYDVDDTFRDSVSLKLKPKPNHHPLPPANFLSLSVQVYFSKFNALFPILHSHTFRPNPKNSLLLLSVCSIGSLLIGSKGAAAQGARIFETLNKAILASWENTVLSKDAFETAAMVQAAIIGQTFGMLLGEPKHLAIVDCFHGTVVSLARRCNMFNHRIYRPRLENLSGLELNNEWKTWARSEEVNRAVLGLYIHDAAISTMFQHEALLRSKGISLPIAADDDVFHAPTATEWRDRMLLRTEQPPPIHKCMHINLPPHQYTKPLPQELSCKSSRLTAYVILCGILTSICEKQQMDQLETGSTNFEKYFEALMCWYITFQADQDKDSNQTDPLCLMILWHTVFMNLLTNFNTLERAIGRDGSQTSSAESDQLYATKWASAIEAKRCILHVHAIQNILGTMRLDAEPAIHIPHCLFLAGIASFCYAQFGHTPAPAPNVNLEFSEFTLRGASIPQHLFNSSQSSADQRGSAQSNGTHNSGPVVPVGIVMLYMLTDMLQRIGHWGIARKLSGVLGALVQADSDEVWLLR